MKSRFIFNLDKCYAVLLLILILCSCLFTEFFSTNIYVVNGYLTFLLLFVIIINYNRNKKLEITYIEIILFLIICFSFLSALIKSQQIQSTVYTSLALYWVVLIQSKSNIKKIRFSDCICYTILFFNIVTFFLLTLSYIKFGEYIPYIEKHFGNTGIYAILLAISSILAFDLIISLKKKYLFLFLLLLTILLNIILIINLQSRLAVLLMIIYSIRVFFSFFKCSSTKFLKKMLFVLSCCLIIYFLLFTFKTNSTEGRWFILERSIDIIRNNYLIGTGGLNTFSLNYPLYQSKYFSTGLALEKEVMLADNTKYAFNEFIQIFTEIGILGIILVLFLLWRSYKIIRKDNQSIQNLTLSLFIASLFYYIFHITIFQTLLFLILINLASKDKVVFSVNIALSKVTFFIVGFICLLSTLNTYSKINYAIELEGLFYQKRPLIEKRDVIQNKFNENSIILGLYAYELYHKKDYIESLTVLNSVEKIYTHSDLINLKGKTLFKLGNIQLAELYFIKSTEICPNRFGYRHDLFKFYLDINNSSNAKKVALQILDLEEKIPSTTTYAIKQEAKKYLNSNSSEDY